MQTYAEVLNYAIPFFVSLILLEYLISRIMKKKVVRGMDMLSSLSSGMTNVIKDVLGLTLIIVSYEWLEGKIGLFDISSTWPAYVLAFIGLDFAGYWIHRVSHHVNYFWNVHIIHHSSEEFNLGCALRQSISELFSISFLFMVPTALLGVPAEVIAVVAPLHLFAQYWYHTRLIGKLGWLEQVIVTPSHHRVHHAINDIYLDKNLSQIFIIWDKLFGTFQKELDEVPPVYGVTRPVRTWNPILINFMHLWQLIKDAWNTRSVWDKLRIWFMPTGWRPSDVAEHYPLDSIKDPYTYEKYDPQLSTSLQWWTWIQFTVVFVLMLYLFNQFSEIGWPDVLVYGGFLFFQIFTFTTLADKRVYAWWLSLLTAAFGLVLIALQGVDWYGLQLVWPYAGYALGLYFVLQAVISSGFVFWEVKPTLQVGAISKVE